MKRTITLFLSLTFALLSLSVEKNYNITITVKGMENKIGVLAYYYGEKRFVKDTLFFDTKGSAAIKGKKNIASGVYLIAFPSMRYNSFDVILNETSFSISTDTFNFIKNATVKNSVENQQMFEDMKYMLPLGKENDSIQKLIKTVANKESSEFKTLLSKTDEISKKIILHRKEIAKKYPATYYTKLLKIMMDIEVPAPPRKKDGSLVDTFFNYHYIKQHYYDDVDFADSGILRSPVFQHKFLKYFDSYSHPHFDSIIVTIDSMLNLVRGKNAEMFQYCLNELFLKYAKSEIMGHDAIYVHLAEKYYLAGLAWWANPSSLTELRERVEGLKPTLIGRIAPNFFVQDSSGKTQMFHDFIPRNKYTALVFWNSDCGHCQQEIPHLKQLYTDSLKAMGVRIFAVSTEQTDSSFRAFAAKNCSPDWITCADMRGVSAFRKEYDVITTPKLFLINKNFKIIAKNIPINNLVDFIKFEDGLPE
ncbi:MAG: redoxin domain-containing protein [Sphingobacteriales bacterium]|nr:redoxin domain-containing protein [Sphingobacteriales bacterium]